MHKYDFCLFLGFFEKLEAPNLYNIRMSLWWVSNKFLFLFLCHTTPESLRCVCSLQKFKMNIANSVINADNASLASMATDQVLDLFSVNEHNTTKTDASTATRQSAHSVIEGLGELWDEKQYETEYDLRDFLTELTD